jgi:phosphatidyl-myo-inositol alpha-mannosyltransferase
MNSPLLRIGFVLDDGLDSPDGVQQYILTLGKWLVSQGHEVHYLVGETKRKDILNVHSIPQNIKVKFNGNKLTVPLPASSKEIKKLLTKLNLDVIHVQVPYSPLFGAKVVKQSDAKSVIIGTFHIFPYGTIARAGTALLGYVLKRNLRRFDAHISVSRSAQQFAKESFKISSEIIPNMVDTSLFTPAHKKVDHNKEIRLLFLGRLVKRKGCLLLLEALAEIKKTNPELLYSLDICGKGALQPDLERFCTENNLTENVIFHGFVGEEDKVRFMQNADIAVFPAYAGESFGIVLIEAMAAQAGVVLGGNNPGYASVLSDVPESLINVTNRKQFVNQLTELLKNSQLREKIGDKQSLLIKRYDVATVGSRIVTKYTECIKSKRGIQELANEQK